MSLRLLIELGSRTLRRALPPGIHLLGSDSNADVRMQHLSVSRRHARLRVEGDRAWVEDLGSKNGTWIDGRRVAEGTPAAAAAGAVLRFGSVGGRLEAAADDDVVVAVPLGGRDRPANVELPTPTSGSTATLAPAQAFWAGEVPILLPKLRQAAPLEWAQEIGAALFRRLPTVEVEIFETLGARRGLLFRAAREDLIEAGEDTKDTGHHWPEGFLVEVEHGRQGIRARFLQQGVARAAEEVLRGALDLLALAPETGARPAPLGSEEPARSQAAPPSPPLPRPPTLTPAVTQIYEQARRVARGTLGVLIRGETGTGKEVLARFLHRASPRARGPWITLNCAALPQDLLEAELFGIERGVATGVDARPGKFEAADGGTLFLDEIGDMAASTQAKILRVLQEGTVHRLGGTTARPANARILAATHQDLELLRAEGDFRDDLFHRIAGWEVTLPPLRRRRPDIPNLAAHFLEREAEALGLRPAGISRAAVDALVGYPWPGNVRQLATEIARAALFLDDGELLDAELLSPAILHHPRRTGDGHLKATLETVEHQEILLALGSSGGSVTTAAERLGLPVSTLYRRMKTLGIQPPDSTATPP